jgi:hypothetical protein
MISRISWSVFLDLTVKIFIEPNGRWFPFHLLTLSAQAATRPW